MRLVGRGVTNEVNRRRTRVRVGVSGTYSVMTTWSVTAAIQVAGSVARMMDAGSPSALLVVRDSSAK
jgi:hypothetical protein